MSVSIKRWWKVVAVIGLMAGGMLMHHVHGNVLWFFAGHAALYPFAISELRQNGERIGSLKEHLGFDLLFFGLLLSVALESAGPYMIAGFIFYIGACRTLGLPVRLGPGGRP